MTTTPVRTHLGPLASEGSRLIAARLHAENAKLRHLAERLARRDLQWAGAAAAEITPEQLRKRTDCFATVLSRLVYGDGKPGRRTAALIANVLEIGPGAWDEAPTSPLVLPLEATGRRRPRALPQTDRAATQPEAKPPTAHGERRLSGES